MERGEVIVWVGNLGLDFWEIKKDEMLKRGGSGSVMWIKGYGEENSWFERERWRDCEVMR